MLSNREKLTQVDLTRTIGVRKPPKESENKPMARKRNGSPGCLFWVALILLVLVIFLFNRGTIDQVMEETGFWQILKHEPEGDVTVTRDPGSESVPELTEDDDQAPPTPLAEQPEGEEPVSIDPEEDGEESILVTEPEDSEVAPTRVRRATLYFVKLDADGNPVMEGISRGIEYNDSPLTTTLENLISGLTATELNRGYLSLIPVNAEIRRIWVEGGVAHIDFNEAIRYNSFGNEGYELQLKQIVYTASEFATVERVQFYVEGQVSEYLAPEGVYIGSPLGRDDF
jgi:germination protein M